MIHKKFAGRLQSKHDHPAFTLLETLMTIAIITLTLGISATLLKTNQPTARLNEAALALESDLRFASELASTTQIPHTVSFNLMENSYALKVSAPEKIIKTVALAGMLSIEATTFAKNTVEFNILGGAVLTGTITLQYGESATKTIEVRPSGYVRIQ